MKVAKFIWELPKQGWVKYNTYGESRVDPRISSYAFFLKNRQQDLCTLREIGFKILQI